jgi:phosphonoacetaldehyde hydrolase
MSMYEEFLPLQKSVLAEGWDVIPGVVDVVNELRRRGMKIGGTTGFTRALMDVVRPRAAQRGYAPEVSIAADDVAAGRPAPWMNFRAAELLGVYPTRAIVVVDDTPVGIEAGRHAGMWTVGVARTGNEFGLSQVDADTLAASDPTEYRRRLDHSAARLRNAGAHYVIDGVADLLGVIATIESGANLES